MVAVSTVEIDDFCRVSKLKAQAERVLLNESPTVGVMSCVPFDDIDVSQAFSRRSEIK